VLHVGRPSLCLCFLDQPIEYGALDGKPVDTLFTIISPTLRAHLRLMAKLSFVLRDKGVRAVVGGKAPRQEILLQIERAENQLAVPDSPASSRVGIAARSSGEGEIDDGSDRT
jgi:PTS system nitrogen regulatory IIA component